MGLKDPAEDPPPNLPHLPMMNNLTRVIIAVSVALALLTFIGVLAFGGLGFGETRQLVQLPWVQPAAQSLIILSAIALAILFLGRGLTLGSAWTFWSGILFLAHGVLSIFYLLSWPGLLGDRGVVAKLPNTTSWFAMLVFSLVALQITAVNARRPKSLKPASFLAGYASAIALSILIGWLSLRFEDLLPAMIVGMRFTPLTMSWSVMLIGMAAFAAASTYQRYRAGEDDMLGYMTLFLLMFAFGLLHSVLGGKSYDLWWYVGRFNLVVGYLVVLFGFLQEGYALFACERERA